MLLTYINMLHNYFKASFFLVFSLHLTAGLGERPRPEKRCWETWKLNYYMWSLWRGKIPILFKSHTRLNTGAGFRLIICWFGFLFFPPNWIFRWKWLKAFACTFWSLHFFTTLPRYVWSLENSNTAKMRFLSHKYLLTYIQKFNGLMFVNGNMDALEKKMKTK